MEGSRFRAESAAWFYLPFGWCACSRLQISHPESILRHVRISQKRAMISAVLRVGLPAAACSTPNIIVFRSSHSAQRFHDAETPELHHPTRDRLRTRLPPSLTSPLRAPALPLPPPPPQVAPFLACPRPPFSSGTGVAAPRAPCGANGRACGRCTLARLAGCRSPPCGASCPPRCPACRLIDCNPGPTERPSGLQTVCNRFSVLLKCDRHKKMSNLSLA